MKTKNLKLELVIEAFEEIADDCYNTDEPMQRVVGNAFVEVAARIKKLHEEDKDN